MIRPIFSNEFVRLVIELPELSLDSGAVGVVRSAWFYPRTAYEVEFRDRGKAAANRILLLEGEVAPLGGDAAGGAAMPDSFGGASAG